MQGAFLAVLGVGGYRVATGSIAVADLVAFILYLFLLVMPLGQADRRPTRQLQTGLGALARMQEVLALEPEHDDVPERPRRAGAVLRVPRAGDPVPLLELDGVGFGYPDGTPVLHGVSFTVPAGSRTALVGPSGAGKSTILALVERFYPLSAGAVRLGGHRRPRAAAGARCAPGWATSSRRRRCWPARCGRTCCWPRRTPTDERAVAGAGRRRAHSTSCCARPAGWTCRSARTACCCPAASGSGWPSPGRCWPARRCCCWTSRPPAWTPATSGCCGDTLAAAAADRALLVVAHRLSTVVDTDQIVVLDAGRVVAVGTHAELVDTNPLYRELATAQLLGVAVPRGTAAPVLSWPRQDGVSDSGATRLVA